MGSAFYMKTRNSSDDGARFNQTLNNVSKIDNMNPYKNQETIVGDYGPGTALKIVNDIPETRSMTPVLKFKNNRNSRVVTEGSHRRNSA